MDEPLLTVTELSKTYRSTGPFARGKRVAAALTGVSLAVAAGEIHALVGESGCGKSTLARCVAGLERPDTGTVTIGEDELFASSGRDIRRARRAVQLIFQDPHGALDPRWRVGRIVAEPLHLAEPRPSRAETRRRVVAALEDVGLSPADAERYPHAFSGGQRQRIAIARALVIRPRLLVADEAVSSLDVSVQAQVLNLFLDLRDREGLALLFIGHDLSVVGAIADRISVMHQGRIVEQGPVDAIFDHPRDPATRRLLEAAATVSPPRAAG